MFQMLAKGIKKTFRVLNSVHKLRKHLEPECFPILQLLWWLWWRSSHHQNAFYRHGLDLIVFNSNTVGYLHSKRLHLCSTWLFVNSLFLVLAAGVVFYIWVSGTMVRVGHIRMSIQAICFAVMCLILSVWDVSTDFHIISWMDKHQFARTERRHWGCSPNNFNRTYFGEEMQYPVNICSLLSHIIYDQHHDNCLQFEKKVCILCLHVAL